MQRKAGGGRQQRRKSNTNDRDPASSKSTARKRSESSAEKTWCASCLRVIGILVVIVLFVVLLYLAAPGGYSRSRPSRSGEPSQRKTREEEEEEKGWADAANEASSCAELVTEARKIMDSGVTGGDEAELALDMLASCALKEPQNAIPRWNIAAALMQMKRVDEAVPFLKEALSLDPTNPTYLLNGGRVLASLRRYKDAIKCLETFFEVSLRIPKWDHLLASISISREDEWEFLHEIGPELVQILETLLNCYLHDTSLIKAGYLYKVVIGLKGVENARELTLAHAFFSFSLGDITTGIRQLRVYTEEQYVLQGYGEAGRAKEVVTAHSLRLLAAGFDAIVTSIAKNLLMSGEVVWEELVYNCNLDEKVDRVDFSIFVSQNWLWRIFSKCLTAQQIIPSLLKDGAAVHAENIFGYTALFNMISLDSYEFIEQQLAAKANPDTSTALGLTALHMAAIRGSCSVVQPLLQAGLKNDSRDALNRTALDVACLHKWSAKNFSSALMNGLPNNCLGKTLYLPPLEQGFKTGGWFGSGTVLPAPLTEERCDFDVIGYNADTESLVLDYMSLQRPVLIRNATNPHKLRQLFNHWQRNKLAKEYGHLTFTEVLVPYAESFGYNHTTTTLKQFLNKMERLNGEFNSVQNVLLLSSPTYIFEAIPPNSPLLEYFAIPEILNPSVTHISMTKTQFYVGPPLSGAPFHFHRNAWNVLIYGLKRWFLMPPPHAHYSRQHVWDWWKTSHMNAASLDHVLECVQHPGDMMFVPDMWGHSVINLRESIGMAAEFIHGQSEFSL